MMERSHIWPCHRLVIVRGRFGLACLAVVHPGKKRKKCMYMYMCISPKQPLLYAVRFLYNFSETKVRRLEFLPGGVRRAPSCGAWVLGCSWLEFLVDRAVPRWPSGVPYGSLRAPMASYGYLPPLRLPTAHMAPYDSLRVTSSCACSLGIYSYCCLPCAFTFWPLPLLPIHAF